MKLLKSAGCLLPADGGNVKEQTMIVEEQGIGFRTGVRFPSAPLIKTNPSAISFKLMLDGFVLLPKYLEKVLT